MKTLKHSSKKNQPAPIGSLARAEIRERRAARKALKAKAVDHITTPEPMPALPEGVVEVPVAPLAETATAIAENAAEAAKPEPLSPEEQAREMLRSKVRRWLKQHRTKPFGPKGQRIILDMAEKCGMTVTF